MIETVNSEMRGFCQALLLAFEVELAVIFKMSLTNSFLKIKILRAINNKNEHLRHQALDV